MVIPAAVRSALVEHAEAERPNEACGLIALRDGRAERYLPGRNAAASPYRFELEVDPEANRLALRQAGLLTRDPRMKERKKYGLKRARKAPQYTKR